MYALIRFPSLSAVFFSFSSNKSFFALPHFAAYLTFCMKFLTSRG